MAGLGSAFTGDAVTDPSTLILHVEYDRLAAHDIGKFCSAFGDLYGLAVSSVSGRRTLVFSRGTKRIKVRPELDVIEAATGRSIRIRFVEGWFPTAGAHEGELEIGIPRKTAIPLIVLYFLVQAASGVLDSANKVQDLRLKNLELEQRRIEEKLKEQELDRPASPERGERLYRRSAKLIGLVRGNASISSFRVNGIELKA